MKAMEHLELASRLGLNAIQISSVGDYESVDPAHLAKVREKAREKSILDRCGDGVHLSDFEVL